MEIEEKIKAVRNRDKSYRYESFVFMIRLRYALQTGYRHVPKYCMKEEYHDYKNNNMETIKITRYQSPVGDMIVGSYGDKLCICDWAAERRRYTIDRRIQRHLNAKYEEGTSEIIQRAIEELDAYFAGYRKIFDIPVVFTGSEFQCTVWGELMKIPYGTTISYGELARRIRNPKAVRAVASANATNPISIFVPCHRVIGSNQKFNRLWGRS